MKAVIFDVDGTLYDQRRLRIRILFDMLRSFAQQPKIIRDIKIIVDFRRAREMNAAFSGGEIEARQYIWGAERSGVTPIDVRRVVDKWMVERPLHHLAACRHAWTPVFFQYLRERDIRIGVFSDYPADEKLRALGLKADIVVSAVDPWIDRLKPDPRGLVFTAGRLGADISDCVFIGDRDDKDGECARQAGMRYHILKNAGRYECYRHLCEIIDYWKDTCKN